ncbi:sensor histidine kinase [Couchioplanes caeruleus]|uniref:histidine kinase n=1 Tax=Couchioplanes caeruleus TaxID=56438 RepID=A0A3N1GF46_9ACTN|nr:sensor histidine kinase [Couchioplanes caeruleus]ROP28840.1 signal transduction histidine kinase [Couchioplanes caeruleus]
MSWSSFRPYQAVLVDLAVAGSVALTATYWWHQFREGGLIFGLLVGCALMWRRHRPVAAFVAVALLSMAMLPIEVHGSHLHEGMLLVSMAVAMYAVVVYAARLKTGIAAGVAAALLGTVALTARTSLEYSHELPGLADVQTGLLLSVGYGIVIWAVAYLARGRRLSYAQAEERAATAERERQHLARIAVAEERTRIARELHDIVAHSLSVMIVHANGGEYALDRDPERARAALRTIGATGRDALVEIKQLVEMLRSDEPDADRTPAGLEQVGAVVERARGAGLAVDLVVDGAPPAVSGGVALAVYRIVQESLTNTLKHAGPAPTATVRLRYRPEAIEVDVSDTGTGTVPAAPGGHGLVGMRERVSLYGGAFDAGPRLDGGWRVRGRIPLAEVQA